MKIEFKKAINLFVLMVCGMVGVGFISGAEIYEFFARFGNFCYAGIALFFCLNFALCYKILIGDEHLNNLQKMNEYANNKQKNTFLNKKKIKSIFVFINVLLISAAMFSGLKVLSNNLLNNNYIYMVFACVIFVFVVLYFGINGLSKVDAFVFLFVVIITVFFGMNAFDGKNYNKTELNVWAIGSSAQMLIGSMLFSCLYVFMNIVQIEPLYKESGIKFSRKSAALFAGLFSALLTALLVVFVEFIKSHNDLTVASMPFLKYFSEKGGAVQVVFVIGLFFAILTTLLSCLVGVKRPILNALNKNFVAFKIKKRKNIKENTAVQSAQSDLGKGKFKNLIATLVAVTLSYLLGFVSFGTYVSVIYPVIGVINFVIFVFL